MADRPEASVCVVGIGYVGLPLATMLARSGHTVVGVDTQSALVEAINNGIFPFEEEAMREAFLHPSVRSNLTASPVPLPASAFVIAVPTPLDHRKRIADLSHVQAALESILPVLRRGNLIIIESTVPPGTCRELATPLIEGQGFRVGVDILLAHCPERILPGDIMWEIVHNDRIVGGVSKEASAQAIDLYSSFVKGRLLETDDVTAELCKLMENTYRDVNVALANEFAAVSSTLGIDPLEAISLANRHPRVNILRPGIGTGGHCIPIDPWFIRQVDPVNCTLMEAARRINMNMPSRAASRIRKSVAGVRAAKIVIVGMTYKPNVPDCRESPALEVISMLDQDGYDTEVFDPYVPGHELPVGGLIEAARGTDCLAILVEHDSVREELAERLDEILRGMATPNLVRFYPAPWTTSHPALTTV